MPGEFPSREMSAMVGLFQRAHNKITALQRLDDQIATLVAQHQRLQDEVRSVQAEINEEFERALRYNQAPQKLPEGMLETAQQRAIAAPGIERSLPAPEQELELIAAANRG